MSDDSPFSAAPTPLKPLRSAMIDFWRAIACLAVVFFHGAENAPSQSGSAFISILSSISHYGWLGVSMFFVISGFCLAQAVQLRSACACGPLSFWMDRLLRIYPVYWASLLLAVILALIATPFNGLPYHSAFPSSPSAWLSNLALVTNWTGHAPRLTVSWSLDFEIGFYVLMGAALVSPLRRTPHQLTLYAALTLLAHIEQVVAWLPLLRHWPAFVCGLAVHTALQTTVKAPIRVIALLYPFSLAASTLLTDAPLTATFAPGFALCLLASVAWEPRLPPPPRIICILGIASYSIYLVHIPFMSPVINFARRVLEPASPALAWVWLGHIIFGVSAGLLFYLLIERRCETLRARWVPKPRPPSFCLSSKHPMIFSRFRQTRPYALLRDARYLWRHRARRAFYASFVKPGSLIFDVGANVGHYTLIFRSLGARVVAIEPQADLASSLARRFPTNSSRVILEKCALGAAPGTAVLHKTADLTEVASLRADIAQTSRFASEHPYVSSETVPVRTLAELISIHGQPLFCKIDVEGFEDQVLAGLNIPIQAVSFEFNREYLDVAETCVIRLKQLGPYRFNYTLGENNHFASPDWQDSATLIRHLRESADTLLWGDIHARLPATKD